MSRTREIEVWVSESIIEDGNSIPNIIRREKYNEMGVRLNGKETLKAKLIIELPSPKITISEEDVDKAFNSIRYLDCHEDALCPYTVRHLRMALFKDAE